MRTRQNFSLIGALIVVSVAVFAQPSPDPSRTERTLHFKTRDIVTRGASPVSEIRSPLPTGRGHLLLQFDAQPTADQIAMLKRRGIDVLQDVPENGLLVSLDRRVNVAGLQVRFAAAIDPLDKISPLAVSSNGHYLVELHPDVDSNSARALLVATGIELRENIDLNPHHLMVRAADSDTLAAIAALDQVAYIFPASDNLVNRVASGACTGALTVNGPSAQSIPVYGDGWDGPGLGAATIGFVFSKMTTQLAPAAAQAEIVRAMNEWSKNVEVTWTPSTSATASRTVSVLFGSYAHGDSYPFDGPGGALAHTYYPAPPNPEPIAGDIHFDDSEIWRIGINTDLFSVALHELGHALGLGHSDSPSAVMYPYYKMVTALSPLDVSAAQTLYAAQTVSSAPPPAPPIPAPTPSPTPTPTPTPAPTPTPSPTDKTPPSLVITTPSSTMVSATSSSIVFSGTASDNVGVAAVTWTTNTGGSGTASGTMKWAANIPLLTGANTVTIRASDAAGNTAWRSVVVTKR